MLTMTVSKISEVQKDFNSRIVKAKGNIQQYLDRDEDETMNNAVFKHNES